VAPPIFPSLPGLAFPVKRSQVWETVRHDALSGKRIRYPQWTYPIYRYEVLFDFLRSGSQAEWQTLAGFIASVQGPAQLWAFNDTNDNAVTNQSFGQTDGVNAGPYQLVRTLGGFTEPVYLPVLTGGLVPQITVGGTPTTNYTVSAYGAVTFNSVPAGGQALAWTGSFYWPCRFDEDAADFENFMSQLWELKSLKFSTEKLP
jgi:hypothetical protein